MVFGKSILEEFGEIQCEIARLRAEICDLKCALAQSRNQDYKDWEYMSAGDCNLESLYQKFKQRMESER